MKKKSLGRKRLQEIGSSQVLKSRPSALTVTMTIWFVGLRHQKMGQLGYALDVWHICPGVLVMKSEKASSSLCSFNMKPMCTLRNM